MDKATTHCTIALLMLVICILIGIVSGSNSILSADSTSQITVLGKNATYHIIIENFAYEADTFNLTTTNIDNASIAVLNRSIITLDAGCNANVILNVTDGGDIGPYSVTVNATSHMNADVTDEIEIITAVIEE